MKKIILWIMLVLLVIMLLSLILIKNIYNVNEMNNNEFFWEAYRKETITENGEMIDYSENISEINYKLYISSDDNTIRLCNKKCENFKFYKVDNIYVLTDENDEVINNDISIYDDNEEIKILTSSSVVSNGNNLYFFKKNN